MASLEEAYSNEYQEIIDAELAYDLYWANVITNKSDFQCPSEFCSAKVTCINLDAEKQSMQQSPHFRGYNHSDECDAHLAFTSDKKNKKDKLSTDKIDADDISKTKVSNPVVSEPVADIFRLQRPAGQFTRRNKDGLHPSTHDASKQAIDVKKARRQNNTETGSDYYSVRSLVSKFIQYRKEDALSEHYVNIAGKESSYKSLFKGVYNQSVQALPDDKLIYWGVVFINYLAHKKVYKITFKNELEHDDKRIRPSFFISETMIDNYPVKSLVLKRLVAISKQKDSRAFVFLYSTPQGKGADYINFDVKSLDYLEIRHMDLFDELKKS